MNKRTKLLTKAKNLPNGLSFDDFETLLKQCGWTFQRQNGSHRVWLSPNNIVLPIQEKSGRAKGYQVKQALRIMEI